MLPTNISKTVSLIHMMLLFLNLIVLHVLMDTGSTKLELIRFVTKLVMLLTVPFKMLPMFVWPVVLDTGMMVLPLMFVEQMILPVVLFKLMLTLVLPVINTTLKLLEPLIPVMVLLQIGLVV